MTFFFQFLNLVLIFFENLFIFYMYGCMSEGLWTIHMSRASEGQKTVPDPPELELWAAVSFHLGAQN